MNFRNYFIQHPRLGKLIGVVLGFLMAGPFGAFLGLFVGNFFDRGLSQHFTKPHWSYRSEREDSVKLYFLKATFAAIGYVAKAEGRITEHLIQSVKQLMQELELNTSEKKITQEFFRTGKDATTNIGTYIFDFRAVAHNHPQLLKLSAEFIYRAAKTEGLTPQKVSRLNEVFQHLGLAPLNIQQRFYEDFFQEHRYQDTRSNHHRHHQERTHSYKGPIDEAYTLLQVSSNAPEAEVKRKYRRLMSQHHPDKLIAKKASVEAIKAANAKTQAISRAYEQIREHRGW